jgi:hypothetical protein
VHIVWLIDLIDLQVFPFFLYCLEKVLSDLYCTVWSPALFIQRRVIASNRPLFSLSFVQIFVANVLCSGTHRHTHACTHTHTRTHTGTVCWHWDCPTDHFQISLSDECVVWRGLSLSFLFISLSLSLWMRASHYSLPVGLQHSFHNAVNG